MLPRRLVAVALLAFFVQAAAFLAAGTVFAQTILPQTIPVPVTFYDFHSDRSNPEFEQPHTGGRRLNMVAATLDGDNKPLLGASPYRNLGIAHWFRDWNTYTAGPYSKGKNTAPVYNPTPGIRQTYSNEWTAAVTVVSTSANVGHDTSFKNIVIPGQLAFMLNTTTGMYEYSSTSFFPLDGTTIPANFGREWQSSTDNGIATHNYAFTMELAFDFQVKEGMVFNFRGDDDVWVFIDKQLVLDLGGIHEPMAGSFSVTEVNGGAFKTGERHTLRVFYAERHSEGSNILIQTNIIAPPAPLNLNYSAGENGAILGNRLQSVQSGESGATVVANPNTGYVFVMWSDGNKSQMRTDTDVRKDISVTAIFALAGEHVLVYAAGAGGSVEGDGIQIVASGGSGTYVLASADSGYVFSRWSDGKQDVARLDSNVTVDAVYTAVFAKIHKLTYSAGLNGTLLGAREQSVVAGSSGSPVVAVPDAGYKFVSWSDGVTDVSRVDDNVRFDLSVTALFMEHKYILSYSTGVYGQILYTGGAIETLREAVDPGADGPQVAVIGNTGYTFYQWSDGKKDAIRQDLNVQEDIIVVASFKDASGKIYVSVNTHDRVIPQSLSGGQAVVVPPSVVLTSEFTAGPNPVKKSSGVVNFFRQGKSIESAKLAVYDASGNLVRRVVIRDSGVAAGGSARRQVGSWDLRDRRGRAVSDGSYAVLGTVRVKGGGKEKIALTLGVM